MKKFSTLLGAFTVATCLLTLSSFKTPKKPKKAPVMAYSIQHLSTEITGVDEAWVWVLTNPNPGNGNNGTLQDVSHWSVPMRPDVEAALVSASYSRDGANWHSIPIEIERDPSIRACTTTDVLKFNVGTNGSEPVYFKAVFNQKFSVNPYAASYIKTGGGMQGCNMYYFAGMGGPRQD